MIVLAWLLGIVLFLAAVNYLAFFFGIDIAGLGDVEEAHPSHEHGDFPSPAAGHALSDSPAPPVAH